MSEEMMQVQQEGDAAFPVATENEDSASSSEEENDINTTPSSEEDNEQMQEESEDGAPGSRDSKSGLNNPTVARWQEREADWKERFNEQEQRHSAQVQLHQDGLEKLRAEMQANPKTEDTPESEGIPEWWAAGDEKGWAKFKEREDGIISKAELRAMERIRSEGEAEKKAVDDATAYLNDEVASIESDKTINPDGLAIDKNKLFAYVEKYDLVDSQGQWNYKSAWLIMQAEKKGKTVNKRGDRKELASATTSGNQPEPKQSKYTTSEDLEKAPPWN